MTTKNTRMVQVSPLQGLRQHSAKSMTGAKAEVWRVNEMHDADGVDAVP
jgi:hypothetical protein